MLKAEQDRKFIETCLELQLLKETDASVLRKAIGDEQTMISQAALQRGFLTPTDIEIVHSLQRPMEIAPGYKLLNLVGRGGMGVVYRAIQTDLERIVALKVILIGNVTQPNAAARFEREAKSLARLQHPNIVQALNFGKHDGRYYFAMEYVPGRTCEQVVRDSGVMSPLLAWSIARQVASGLLHALRQNLIHRDIKPANLMLVPPPEGSASQSEVVKITDFGLAMFTDPSPEHLKLTTGEKVMGSPAYMSPEQFGGRQVDFRSDIYSLGATTWHLLFGTPPHDGKSIPELYQQKSDPLTYQVDELPVRLPPAQLQLLARLLDPRPDRRPESYEQLIAAIDALDSAADTARGNLTLNSVRPHAIRADISDQPTVQKPLSDLSPAASTDSDTPELPGDITETLELPTGPSVTRPNRFKWLAFAGATTLIALASLSTLLFSPGPGERTQVRVVGSTPLFDGVTLSGWDVGGSMSGAWNTVEAPDSSTAIACTSRKGALTRRYPETQYPRISLFVWLQRNTGTVDIDFSFDPTSPSTLRGCLRLTGESIELGTKVTDFGEIDGVVSTPALPSTFDRFHVIDIERQPADWFVFLEERFLGSMPIDQLGDGNAIRLVVHDDRSSATTTPQVFFADVQLDELGPADSDQFSSK